MTEKKSYLNSSQARLRFMDLQKAFQEDCEKILLKFSSFTTYDFEIFRNIWLEHRFSLIFLGKYRDCELPQFTQMCFNCVKKYLVYSANEFIKIGAVYMLYGLYYKQPMQNLAKIRLLLSELKLLKGLMNKMKSEKNLHALYIYRRLLNDGAFEFHFAQYSLGIESQYVQSDLDLPDDTFPVNWELSEDFKKITDQKLEAIYETDRKYSEGLQEFIRKKQAYIDIYPLRLREDIDNIVQNAQSAGTSSTADGTNSESVPAQKRIKDKAFSNSDDSFWRRTKVGKMREDIEEEL